MSPVARLIVLDGPDAGQEHLVTGGRAMLGRSLQCEVVLADELASRQHARLRWQDGEWTIEDLDSRNGTFANEQQLQPHMPYPLYSGDRMRLASTVLAFEEMYDEWGTPPSGEAYYPETAPGTADGSLHPLIVAMIGVAALLLLLLAALAALVIISL